MSDSTTHYDVIIIGAGPAGIFAALELSHAPAVRALVVEKGKDIDARVALAEARPGGYRRDPEALLTGWGGAGAFSDGKLTMSPEVGGQLTTFVPRDEVEHLISEVDQIYLRFGAPEQLYGIDEDGLADLARRAARADLQLLPTRIRHMGTDRCPVVLREMRSAVGENVAVRTGVSVSEILAADDRVTGVVLENGERIFADYVIVAPGRYGSDWLAQQADKLGLDRVDNPVDVGVRVECAAPTMEDITRVAYESKLVYYSRTFDDRIRTFCMCPHGEVVTESNNGVVTVNGHSYAHKKTGNTNFALLVSTSFTEPFHQPIAYGRYLASLANLLGGGVLVQRLGDLRAGRRSTPERIARNLVQPTLKEAAPGDLSFALPYRHLTGIMETLDALDKLAPGLAARHTLLYGVEVKFYSARPKLTPALETQVQNLFAIGDGAGVTRGLVQASGSGLLAAREILHRLR
jgi:hypothetical protein